MEIIEPTDGATATLIAQQKGTFGISYQEECDHCPDFCRSPANQGSCHPDSAQYIRICKSGRQRHRVSG